MGPYFRRAYFRPVYFVPSNHTATTPVSLKISTFLERNLKYVVGALADAQFEIPMHARKSFYVIK